MYVTLSVKAQDSLKVAVGINYSSSVINFLMGNFGYDGGICLEPVFLYSINDFLISKTVVGYSKISKSYTLLDNTDRDQELDYINKGAYIKTGVYAGYRANPGIFHPSFLFLRIL